MFDVCNTEDSLTKIIFLGLLCLVLYKEKTTIFTNPDLPGVKKEQKRLIRSRVKGEGWGVRGRHHAQINNTIAHYSVTHCVTYLWLKLKYLIDTEKALPFRWRFSNYWMRLSRIWRILQIKEGVIHRGRRPRWITPSEICRILHILLKPNSIIALLFIQNIFPFLKEFRHIALCFLFTKITQSRPQVFSVNGLIICSGLHFWRHLTSSVH